MSILCLHKWKIKKVFMDEKEKNKLFVKEVQICTKCHIKRAFTYSQTVEGNLDVIKTDKIGSD